MKSISILFIIPFLALTLGAGETTAPDQTKGEPVTLSATQFLNGEGGGRMVRLTGRITDVTHDELNPQFRFFIVNSSNETFYVSSGEIRESDAALEALIGAEISVCGTDDYPSDSGTMRRQFRRTLSIAHFSDITVLKPAPADPFAVDELERLTDRRPAEIPMLGRRHVRGRVLAVWRKRNFLVRTPENTVLRVEALDKPLPKPGDFVEAVGIPESDIFRVNLARAIWRPADPFPVAEDGPATNLSARAILTDGAGHTAIKAELHGRLVRLTGLLRSRSPSGVLYLEDGEFLFHADARALPELPPDLTIGCRIAVTGICIMNVKGWRPTDVFPQIDGFTLVPRTAGDIEILSHPPWWTVMRMLVVIVVLVLLLTAILIWNRSLRILAERRGKTLLKEQLGRVKNRLKIGERTRLAVELHDSLAQSLTGIAFEINAADSLAAGDPAASRQHLSIASRLLRSCREELRNCIWELRSQTLEVARMDDAVRQTLAPHIGTTALTVRFNVPRHRLSDNTAHALLRIIRELVLNAIRHGHATAVRIAGSLDADRLSFSVADNGCGFDPEYHPGVEEGHFGLQGIRERIARQNGEMTVASSPGSGTKVTVHLQVRTPEEEEDESL